MTTNAKNNAKTGENLQILVIDDEEGVRDMLRDMLEDAGYKVITAGEGSTGLTMMENHGADLVITDILMPDKEGIATIVELRRRDPQVKIIAMSGGGRTGNLDFLKTAEKTGAAATLAKPFTMQRLLKTVHEVLGDKP